MKLTELEPIFLKWISESESMQVDDIQDADGIQFCCPECFIKKGNSIIGVHSCICWKPNIDQNTHPIPGRWNFVGTNYSDLTLVAGSSSILLKDSPCKAHFFIRNGEIISAM